MSTTPAGGRLTAGFVVPPSESNPGRVWIGFENVTDERREFEFGPTPPFSNYWASSDGHQRTLLLVPDDGRRFPYGDLIPDEPTDGQWVTKRHLGKPTGSVGGRLVELEPGESLIGEYALLVHPDGVDRDPPAVHSFEASGAPTTLGMAEWTRRAVTPGPSRFEAGRTPPQLPTGDRTDWFHAARNAAITRPFLEPGVETLEPPAETTLFLRNPSFDVLTARSATLFERDEGGWRRVGSWEPLDDRDPAREPERDRGRDRNRQGRWVAPGQTTRARLNVQAAGDNEGGEGPGTGEEEGPVLALSPGLYAVQFGTGPLYPSASLSPLVVAGRDSIPSLSSPRSSVTTLDDESDDGRTMYGESSARDDRQVAYAALLWVYTRTDVVTTPGRQIIRDQSSPPRSSNTGRN